MRPNVMLSGAAHMSWIDQFVEMLFPLDARRLNIEGAFLLKHQHLPPSIFKYRSVTDHTLKNLDEDTVWLADPRSLNDPYDCAHSTDLDRMSCDLLCSMPPDLAAMLSPEKFPSEVLAQLSKSTDPEGFLIDTMFSGEPTKKRERIKEEMRDLLHTLHEDMVRAHSETLKGAFKLCSFSERLDSTLMWAHYADYHKGFCIEYDVRAFPPSDYRSRFLYPVIYTDRLYDATPHYMKGVEHETFNNLHLNLAGLSKSIDWKYEQEWRLLFANGVLKEAQAYPMGKPKAVYLGSHIESGNQERVLAICTRRDIPVKKMRHSSSMFLMEPCSIQDADRKLVPREPWNENAYPALNRTCAKSSAVR